MDRLEGPGARRGMSSGRRSVMGKRAQGNGIENRARGELLGSGDVNMANWHTRRAFVLQLQHPAIRSRRLGAHGVVLDV